MGTVNVTEAFSIRVGRFLQSRGFTLASRSGFAQDQLFETDSFGLLQDSEAEARKSWFGLRTVQPRRIFLGVIWFSNGHTGATVYKWDFNVYGVKHLPFVKQLADELAAEFNVEINIRLVREREEMEAYHSDYLVG